MPPKVLEVTKPINHKTNKRMMIVSNMISSSLIKLCLSAFVICGFNYCASNAKVFLMQHVNKTFTVPRSLDRKAKVLNRYDKFRFKFIRPAPARNKYLCTIVLHFYGILSFDKQLPIHRKSKEIKDLSLMA